MDREAQGGSCLTQSHRLHDLQTTIRLLHLIYRNIIPGMIAEAAAAVLLVVGLKDSGSGQILSVWLGVMMTVLLLQCFFVQFNTIQSTRKGLVMSITLLSLLVAVSGLLWGIAGSALVPADDIPGQIFVSLMLIGVTTAANAVYSPIILLYFLFLLTAFIPFTIWLYSQGSFYILLSVASLVYILLMVATSMFFNRLVRSSFSLHDRNANLEAMNQILEEEVNLRTADLHDNLAITRSILESTGESMLVSNQQNRIDFCNHHFLDQWSVTAETLENATAEEILQHIAKQLQKPEAILRCIETSTRHPESVSTEDLHLLNGHYIRLTTRPRLVNHRNMGRIWIFSDITLQKGIEQQLIYQASHDLLTQLPNRAILYDRLEQAIHFAKRSQSKVGVLFLDLDNFKHINDTFGHDTGDLLLVEVATRVKTCLRESDTVSRFGGDEFVVVFNANTRMDLSLLTPRIQTAVQSCAEVIPVPEPVMASIGISIFPDDGNDAETLLKHADFAMYHAKQAGKNRFSFYGEIETLQNHNDQFMAKALKEGLKNHSFFLMYQPVIALPDGIIAGAEALIRWKHPSMGILLPDAFIPLAEENGTIIPLGEWVLRAACKQAKAWQALLETPFHMAVNVSESQFCHPGFEPLIRSCLVEYGLSRGTLEIEITDARCIQKHTGAFKTLKILQELGVRVSINHTGDGYASLNYLKTFRVDKLKIDRSWIRDCKNGGQSATIIETLVTLSKGMELSITAEGVETMEQHRFLESLQCNELQGYLYGKPMISEEFEALFLSQNSAVRDQWAE